MNSNKMTYKKVKDVSDFINELFQLLCKKCWCKIILKTAGYFSFQKTIQEMGQGILFGFHLEWCVQSWTHIVNALSEYILVATIFVAAMALASTPSMYNLVLGAKLYTNWCHTYCADILQ